MLQHYFKYVDAGVDREYELTRRVCYIYSPIKHRRRVFYLLMQTTACGRDYQYLTELAEYLIW